MNGAVKSEHKPDVQQQQNQCCSTDTSARYMRTEKKKARRSNQAVEMKAVLEHEIQLYS